jgi:hypothetical protein
MGVTINDLIAATAVSATDQMEASTAAGSRRMSVQQLQDFIAGGALQAANNLSDVDPQRAAVNLHGAYVCATYAEFQALDEAPQAVLIQGKTAPFDGWGGIFVRVPGSTTGDDGAMCIRRAAAGDTYKRLAPQGHVYLAWFGGKGDNLSDNAAAFSSAFDYIATLGNSDYGAARLYLPPGRIKTSPVTTGVFQATIIGTSSFGTRITAFTTGQSHLIDFTQDSASITFDDVEILGWLSPTSAAQMPLNGIIFSGDTVATLSGGGRMRVYNCQTCVWVKKGHNVYMDGVMFGNYSTAAVRLAGSTIGTGSDLSETRINKCKMGTSWDAFTTDPGDGSYPGVGILLDSNNGATVIENCDGGGNDVFLKIDDQLGTDPADGTGFCTLRGVTTGNCWTAGVYIKDGGGSFAATGSNFSAHGPTGYGLRIASPLAAPRLYSCDFHDCKAGAVLIEDGHSLTMQNTTIRDVGDSVTPGVLVKATGGNATIVLAGMVIDPGMTSAQTSYIQRYVQLDPGFSGTCKVSGLVSAVTPTDKDYFTDPASTGKIYAQHRTIAIANDGFVALPVINQDAALFSICAQGSPATASFPQCLIAVKANAVAAPGIVAAASATNIATAATALTGTTGTAGKLTFGADGTGKLYIENRMGATRTLVISRVSGL